MAITQNGRPITGTADLQPMRTPIVTAPVSDGKSIEDALHLLAGQLDGVTWDRSGRKFMALCPAHEDRTPSLSVAAETTRGKPLGINCFAGCDPEYILVAIGYTWPELYAAAGIGNGHPVSNTDAWMPCGMHKDGTHDWRHQAVKTYPYRDASGGLVFAVARCALKGNGCTGFSQWRPDATTRHGKRWSLKLDDGTRVGDGLPYRLPEALMALRGGPFTPNLWIVEGEKDVERLRSMGYTATCNAGGAGKWIQAHAEHFRTLRPDVIIVADHDRPGWAHAEAVARTFVGFARSVEVRRARSEQKGADLSDHLDAGYTLRQLVPVATPMPDPGLTDFEEWAR